MRHGAWHQLGFQTQTIAKDVLDAGIGVGVIISPRDLAYSNAKDRAEQYRELGADVLIDQQFYDPSFVHKKLSTYPTNEFRLSISKLARLSDHERGGLATALEDVHVATGACALIAPAVIYEAGRNDIIDLNAQLFEVAKSVGDHIGIPTFATVAFGRSITRSSHTAKTAISPATALQADGWYYIFEFDDVRLPFRVDSVVTCGEIGLAFATTGKPVLHAYAGPIGLLSLGFGAIGVGISQSQVMWHFHRRRFDAGADTQSGRAGQPRFFSSELWGTIVYPDEITQLSAELREQILTHSPFSENIQSGSFPKWSRGNAERHLVHTIGSKIMALAAEPIALKRGKSAIKLLDRAVSLHKQIQETGIALRDDTNAYQLNWMRAMKQIQSSRSDDFDFLDLL